MSVSFYYEAISTRGEKLSGELRAGSRGEALKQLQGKGVRPTSLVEQKGKSKKAKQVNKEKKKAVVAAAGKAAKEQAPEMEGGVPLKKKDIIAFTEELSELLAAGLPLEPALASMAGRDEHGVLKQAAAKLRAYVTDGIPIHTALPKVSKHFDALYCSLVAAGEASGSLTSILQQHGNYLKEQAELRSRLTLAMIYPGFLLLACIAVSFLFLFYLLPQITGLLTSMKGQGMPLGIELAIKFGDFLKAYWVHLIILICVSALGLKFAMSREENKARWDDAKLNIPFFGKIFQYGFYVQWLQTLGNLLGNGVPLVQGLELTSETVTNRYLKHRLEGVTEKVRDGYSLTNAMKQADMFPTNMLDLVGVGETTGKLSRALLRAGEYYDKRLNVLLRGIVGVITPIILIGMAVIVGMLCYTMVQAIYQTINNFRR